MAIVIESPNENYSIRNSQNKSVFLAGGIKDCPKWQEELISLLKNESYITIFNPRRNTVFKDSDYDSYEEQVCWEYDHLKRADILSFWFSEGSLNPTTLYEFGKWATSSDRPLVVGINPKYEKKRCVETQLKIARPDINIVYSLEELAEEIKNEVIWSN